MKKILWLVIISSTIALTTSCSKDKQEDSLFTNPQAQEQAVISGSWKVTLFTDSGNDETSDFAGYSFQFQSNGTLTATKNSVSKTGTWTLLSSSNKLDINLGPKTNDNKPLGELTDDWVIISISNSEIKLKDDNASSDELLTFRKL